jgi:hypothetical protein
MIESLIFSLSALILPWWIILRVDSVTMFNCCYLIQSTEKPKSVATYIGYSTNPSRRLRQHNGEIQGGARKTFVFYDLNWNIIY